METTTTSRPGRRARRLLTLAPIALVVIIAAACIPNPVPDLVPVRDTVYPRDFPDPSIVHDGTDYYAYGTNVWLYRTPLLHSTDLVHWDLVGDALHQAGTWASDDLGHTWAPAVIRLGGAYVEYYTAMEAATGEMCVGRATSAAAAGPFVDPSTAPLLCQRPLGGSIDPSPFVDADGSVTLVFKSDTNSGRGTGTPQPTALWSLPLSADGLSVTGPAVELMDSSGGTDGFRWHSGLVEGPAMVAAGGHYWLFYSGMKSGWTDYGVGFASCDSPQGPCVDKTPDFPWATKTTSTVGIGGESFFTDASGQLMMAFHALIDPKDPGAGRALHIERVTMTDKGPTLGDPGPLSAHAQ